MMSGLTAHARENNNKENKKKRNNENGKRWADGERERRVKLKRGNNAGGGA